MHYSKDANYRQSMWYNGDPVIDMGIFIQFIWSDNTINDQNMETNLIKYELHTFYFIIN